MRNKKLCLVVELISLHSVTLRKVVVCESVAQMEKQHYCSTEQMLRGQASAEQTCRLTRTRKSTELVSFMLNKK